jgi:MFS family permease
LVAEIRSGVIWLWRQPTLKRLNLLTAGRTAIASGLYLLVVVLARGHHASTAAIGGIFAVSALGGILGAVVAGRLHDRFDARLLLWATTGVTWILVSCYLLATNVALLAALTALVYFVGPLYEVSVATRSLAAVPDGLRGRVISVLRLVELASYSLGFFVTGMLLQSMGSAWTIACLSMILFALTLFARLNPSFRTL